MIVARFAIIDAYMDRSLVETLKARAERELRESVSSLSGEEGAVLGLLQQHIERELAASPNAKQAKPKNGHNKQRNRRKART